ncbi:hypothetical protein QUW48_07015 [Bifidobacterium pullorum]|uniref:hypothetical protein n=1 Tax=Bifidobacterium pullorum TaxID=78448 RepID=UPI0025A31906|nr:hypothetical protein [Bifidobacterium pullorum]MDM8323285.1 hypothetical protein [Bifidobacterium pullorum]
MGIENLYGDFLPEASEPYYIWIGKELNPALQEGNGSLEMLVGVDQVAEYPSSFRPIVKFFSELRPESIAKKWLGMAQAPDDALQIMVDHGDLAVIRPRDGLDALHDIRLQANGRLVIMDDGTFAISSYALDVPEHEIDEIVKTMLFTEKIGDIPKTMTMVARALAVDTDTVKRSLYHYLPLLFAGRYAFLLHEEIR